MTLKDRLTAAKNGSLTDDFTDEEKQEIHLRGKLAAAILNKRYELHLTQTQFGELFDIPQGKVSRLENGEENITLDTFHDLMNKLGYDVTISPAVPESAANYTSVVQPNIFILSPKFHCLSSHRNAYSQ